MQPRLPQGQRAPPRLTTMWPISPAEPRPCQSLAAEDEAAADPGAPEDAEHRVVVAAGAELALGVGRDADVVADRRPGAERLGEPRAEREAPVQSGRFRAFETIPAFGLDLAGRADADPGQRAGLDAGGPAASRSAAAIASATACGPPSCGVGRRASPSTVLPESTMIAWIFVPPRSIPPRARRSRSSAARLDDHEAGRRAGAPSVSMRRSGRQSSS